jgi:TolB-like protein/Flp pilus assembly protein TadD
MIYRFDLFLLDVPRRELRRGEELVPVEPQVFDFILTLIEARERVVSRDELLERVWGGRIVSEATIGSRLNAARAALGDKGAEQRLIRTFPRKGVRFIGEVRELPQPELKSHTQSATASIAAPRAGVRLPGLAVLPFANMSGNPDEDYFADGMADEIITALSRSSSLFVVARSSSFTYKGRAADVRQIGQELGVGYVLQGGVRRGRDRLRITGQLVDAGTGVHLWSDRFDGDPVNVLELQERVAERVAAAIEPTLQMAEVRHHGRDLAPRLDAYDLLLRANALLAEFTPGSMAAALDRLGEALAIDPTYAPAMASLAYTRAQCDFQGWIVQGKADREEAVRSAWRAAELAPDDAQVAWMAAFSIWAMSRSEGRRARDLFARSLLLNPNSAMALTLAGWIEIMCGNVSEGRAMVSRAQMLNPRDPRGWLMFGALALASIVEEDYVDAKRSAEQALALNRRFAVALRVLAVASVRLGDIGGARRAVAELLVIEPSLTISGFFARVPFPQESMASNYVDALKGAGLPD